MTQNISNNLLKRTPHIIYSTDFLCCRSLRIINLHQNRSFIFLFSYFRGFVMQIQTHIPKFIIITIMALLQSIMLSFFLACHLHHVLDAIIKFLSIQPFYCIKQQQRLSLKLHIIELYILIRNIYNINFQPFKTPSDLIQI